MELFKKTIFRDIIINVIYLILIVIYFICFNTQVEVLDSVTLDKYIDISSITFLFISIIIFEIGYRKEKAKIFINGIEFLTLAIVTLLIKHMPKVLGYTIRDYSEVITYAFLAYYILKSAFMFTRERYNQLKNLSDIKEIVKEEPRKKETKRKNIKIKEGN